MSFDLPKPIAAYIEAGANLDADAMAASFADDATVDDSGDGHQPEGKEEIRAWIENNTVAVKAIFSPTSAHEQAGRWILAGPVAGNFPGSPVNLQFSFQLRGEKIAALTIR